MPRFSIDQDALLLAWVGTFMETQQGAPIPEMDGCALWSVVETSPEPERPAPRRLTLLKGVTDRTGSCAIEFRGGHDAAWVIVEVRGDGATVREPAVRTEETGPLRTSLSITVPGVVTGAVAVGGFIHGGRDRARPGEGMRVVARTDIAVPGASIVVVASPPGRADVEIRWGMQAHARAVAVALAGAEP